MLLLTSHRLEIGRWDEAPSTIYFSSPPVVAGTFHQHNAFTLLDDKVAGFLCDGCGMSIVMGKVEESIRTPLL
jgi:hypothetical protein